MRGGLRGGLREQRGRVAGWGRVSEAHAPEGRGQVSAAGLHPVGLA